MSIEKNQIPSAFQRYLGVIRNGLFFYGLRNRLASVGIDISNYYWVQEECKPCEEPVIRDDVSEYTFRGLALDEVKKLYDRVSLTDYDEMVERMKNRRLCVGIEHNNEIVCFMFIELDDFELNRRTFKLNSNEAFLLNMWTFHAYRGRNLAPYLRYKTYRMLEERGVNVKYSVTQYFNKSSIKFKNKLNSKHLYYYLSIVLFKKFIWNFTLKKYD